jgi:hypothetical protein
MNSETKTKLISRIALMKNKADLKSLMENASHLHADIDKDVEIQKAVQDKTLLFGMAAAAARAAKAKPATTKKPASIS